MKQDMRINSGRIIADLYQHLASGDLSLMEVFWQQHCFHESRRWDLRQLLADVDISKISDAEKHDIVQASRAELTAKPGADRLVRQADIQWQRWQESDPTLAGVFQAISTWARYWNEEEGHHEIAFNRLSRLLGVPDVDQSTILQHRQSFPDDNMLRTLTLLTCTEIAAFVGYSTCSARIKDPGLATLFRKVAEDESQHMTYFMHFASALVASGRFVAKDAMAVGLFFLKEDGEFQGASREKIANRETHVNWWDHFQADDDRAILLENMSKKCALVLHAVNRITGEKFRSIEELEDGWQQRLMA